MQDRGEKPADRVGLMTEIKQIIVGVDGSDNSRAATALGLRRGCTPWRIPHRRHGLARAGTLPMQSAVRLAAPRGLRDPARAGDAAGRARAAHR